MTTPDPTTTAQTSVNTPGDGESQAPISDPLPAATKGTPGVTVPEHGQVSQPDPTAAAGSSAPGASAS